MRAWIARSLSFIREKYCVVMLEGLAPPVMLTSPERLFQPWE